MRLEHARGNPRFTIRFRRSEEDGSQVDPPPEDKPSAFRALFADRTIEKNGNASGKVLMESAEPC